MKALSRISFFFVLITLMLSCSKTVDEVAPSQETVQATEVTTDVRGEENDPYRNTCSGVSISTGSGTITANITASNVNYIKVFQGSWQQVGFICTSWSSPNCNNGSSPSISVSQETYFVQVAYTNGTSCHIYNVVVGGGGCTTTTIAENCSNASVEKCDDTITVTLNDNSMTSVTINEAPPSWNVIATVCADWDPTKPCNSGTFEEVINSSGDYFVQFYNGGQGPACTSDEFTVQ